MISSDGGARFLKKKKKMDAQWAQTEVSVIFFSLNRKFSLKLHIMIVCDNVKHLVEVKPTKRKFETGQNRAQN